MNLEDMIGFPHRGLTYYSDDTERIFDASGKILGYISSRGSQYAWGALTHDGDEEIEFARGHGLWEPKHNDEDADEPALDAILNAHAHLCGVCRGRGKVKSAIGPTAQQVECSYCHGAGVVK